MRDVSKFLHLKECCTLGSHIGTVSAKGSSRQSNFNISTNVESTVDNRAVRLESTLG